MPRVEGIEEWIDSIVTAEQDSSQQTFARGQLLSLILAPLEEHIARKYAFLPDDVRGAIAIGVVEQLCSDNYENLRAFVRRRDELKKAEAPFLLRFLPWLWRRAQWHAVSEVKKLQRRPGAVAGTESDQLLAETKSCSISLAYDRLCRTQEGNARTEMLGSIATQLSDDQRTALSIFHEQTVDAPDGEKHARTRQAYALIRERLGLASDEAAQTFVKVAHQRAKRWVLRTILRDGERPTPPGRRSSRKAV